VYFGKINDRSIRISQGDLKDPLPLVRGIKSRQMAEMEVFLAEDNKAVVCMGAMIMSVCCSFGRKYRAL
jgi:hypothetical protein